MTVFPIIVSNALWFLFNFNPFFSFLFTLYYMLAVGKLASHCFRMTSLVLFKCVWPSLSWLIKERECRHFCACFTFQNQKGLNERKSFAQTAVGLFCSSKLLLFFLLSWSRLSHSASYLGFSLCFGGRLEIADLCTRHLKPCLPFANSSGQKRGRVSLTGLVARASRDLGMPLSGCCQAWEKLYCVVKSSLGHVLHFPSLLNKTLSPWSSVYIPVFEVNQKPIFFGGGGSWCEKQWRSGLVC